MANFWPVLKAAFRALNRNKMRSMLTMLGIIIGVSAVIAMVSVGQGATAMVQDQISSIGTNMMFIWPGSINQGGVRLGAGAQITLTAEDSDAIGRECPAVAAASPVVNASAQMVAGDQNWFTRVQGTSEGFPRIRDWGVQEGDFFTAADVQSAARVVVIGQTVAQNLLPGIDPVGQIIRVKNMPFKVVGVLTAKGQSMVGQDQDDTAIMPYTTVMKKLLGDKIPHIHQIMVSAASAQLAGVAESQISALLRQRHNLRGGQPDDFQIRNMTDVAQAAEQTNFIMTLLLGSIAAVSLLVGGIGIMNIMLVSVTERTREIGICMAVGARPRRIREQFLTESVVLCLIGGLIGVVLGGGLAMIISHLLSWPTLLSPVPAVISFGFAALVGIFFGYYPAHKAASLDPIEALRYE
ncbi:MAG TPA: ABC transporter permease [Vicinamibacterales bacterium]|jgi:putative ABC transport system permease protein